MVELPVDPALSKSILARNTRGGAFLPVFVSFRARGGGLIFCSLPFSGSYDRVDAVQPWIALLSPDVK